jgi:hypothetical protein
MHFSFIAKYQIDNTPCIVVVSVDITERKKNRRALKGNECAAYFLKTTTATCGRIVTCQYRTFQNEQKKKKRAQINQCQQ